ncbi:MFS transporter [Myceligenerans indicum]|uniref:MFS transporter n=1 Tax=Myceligenerans indicum TaxID=2593663 RepID=A0ABS1LQ72_9MICO|nr:MFS transporter [Myceligenerans indicum]MBL0888359.1 MFS transporter [Myceligenerans indicum]
MTSADTSRPPTETGFARRNLMLPIALVAMFMAQFDLYVVNVALPVLEDSLGAGDAQLQLIVGGYAFTYAAGLLIGGRLGDHFGHANMFRAGMLAFGVASLLCGIAPGAGWLVAFRLLQGATAAMMVPQVLALITAAFPPAERPHALARYGMVMGVGAVAGQVLGGVLLQYGIAGLGWRVIFLINVPIALVTVALALRNFPQASGSSRARLDVGGLTAIVLGLSLVLFPLITGRSTGWPWWSWALLVLAVPVLAGAVAWERRVMERGERPILSLGLFRERAFNLGLVLSVVLFGAFFSFIFCLTLMLQDGLGLSPLMAGLTFGPLGIAFAVASVGGRGLVQRYGAKAVAGGTTLVAVALVATGVLLLVRGPEITALELVVPMTAVGLGNGLAVPAVIGQVLARIQPANAGAAAGVLTTAQQFASALGIAVIGGIFFQVLGSSTDVAGLASGLAAAVWCDLALVILGIWLALRLSASRRDAPSA